jgi:hypothetical protein
MNEEDDYYKWPHLEENDPPLDLSRESAAFERQRARLYREHPGWIALIRGDEVIGAYPTFEEAAAEGFRLFGHTRYICRTITEKDEPEFITHVDINHPSFRRTDQ